MFMKTKKILSQVISIEEIKETSAAFEPWNYPDEYAVASSALTDTNALADQNSIFDLESSSFYSFKALVQYRYKRIPYRSVVLVKGASRIPKPGAGLPIVVDRANPAEVLEAVPP